MAPDGAGRPAQLDLFEQIVPSRGRIYTQSLALWDQVPKAVLGPATDPATGKAVTKGARYLPIQSRPFVHDGVAMIADIAPARLRGPGGFDRDALPGLREILVEQAIRKLAIQKRRTAETIVDSHGRLIGAAFHIGEIRTDLARFQHTYSWTEVRDALLVASGAVITIRRDLDGRILARAPIFPVATLPGEASDGAAYVAFHPLVTASIDSCTFRQTHYQTMMTLKSSVARWLHCRMMHRFRQADHLTDYTIYASTILADSGLCRYSRLRDRLAAVDDAVEELRASAVLTPGRAAAIGAPSRQGMGITRGRAWIDTKFILYAAPPFIDDIKTANVATKRLRMQAGCRDIEV